MLPGSNGDTTAHHQDRDAAYWASDGERQRAANLLRLFIVCTLVLCLLYACLLAARPEMHKHLPKCGVAGIILASMYLLLRTGRVWLTAHLLLAMLWTLSNVAAYSGGGADRPAFAWNMVLLMLAALTLGARVCLLYASLTFVAGAWFTLLRISGSLQLPPESKSPMTGSSAQLLGIATVTLLAVVAANLLRRSFEQKRAHGRELTMRNRELAAALAAQRDAEAALQATNDRLRMFVSSIPAMAFALDGEGRFIFADGKALSLMGMVPSQLVGRLASDVYQDSPQMLLAVQRALRGEEFSVLVNLQGLSLDTWYSPSHDAHTGAVTGTTGIALDVSRRQRAEESLEKRLIALTHPLGDTSGIRLDDLFNIAEIQKLQDAFAEATGVASLITDVDGKPITRPSGFCRLCSEIIRGTPAGAANCMKSAAVIGCLRADSPNMQPCLSGGLLDGGTSIRAGDRHIANWLVGQVVDESVDMARVLAYADTIGADRAEFAKALSEVRRMPRERFEKVCQALHLLADQLSRLALQNVQQARYITERRTVEEELRGAKSAAEAANLAKDQFLAMLSHELRTPLTPVLLSISELATSTGLTPSLKQELAAVQRHVEMEARLIDDLLDLSRVVSGKLSLRLGTCDIHAAIQTTLRMCQDDLAQKQISVGQNLLAVNPIVNGDLGRLQQVLWNLLKNAVKFTPAGGEIKIRTCDEDNTLVLHLSDNGEGIESSEMPRIFGMFQQAGSRSRQLGGLGIGLAVCKTIVEAHHGSISVASDGLGQGSTFTVRLPAAVQDSPPLPLPPDIAAHTQHRTLDILLVEDHLPTATLMAKLLSRQGHRVRVAHCVAEALRQASTPFELLISDIGLPDGNGADLLVALRKDRPPFPAIALSGFGMEHDLKRSRDAGFTEHIVKPVDVARLHAAIRHAASMS